MTDFTWSIPDAAVIEELVLAAPTEPMARVDHVVAGLSRLAQQWRDKQHMIDVLACFLERYNVMEDALQALWLRRTIDTANADAPNSTIGAQLDQIGKKVGQPRNGLTNDVYRRYCRARIATNNSNGLDEDMIKIAVLIINDPAAYVLLRTEQVATSSMQILGIVVSATLADVLVQFLRLAVAGGVRFLLRTSPASSATTFTFSGGSGIGFGAAADANQPTLIPYGATGATGGKLSNVRE